MAYVHLQLTLWIEKHDMHWQAEQGMDVLWCMHIKSKAIMKCHIDYGAAAPSKCAAKWTINVSDHGAWTSIQQPAKELSRIVWNKSLNHHRFIRAFIRCQVSALFHVKKVAVLKAAGARLP